MPVFVYEVNLGECDVGRLANKTHNIAYSGSSVVQALDDKRVAYPFLKWAGSKQKLLHHFENILPTSFGRYFEPFLGSAAMFFHLAPTEAVLSDRSTELISTYEAVRDSTETIVKYLAPLKPNKTIYYRIRNNRSSGKVKRAAEFIYLNKSCWNGLYRVNSRGEFNVPYGDPKSDHIFNRNKLRACASLLSQKGVSLRSGDFEDTVSTCGAGDLVFFDPPYVLKHNNNGFRDWNEVLFSWQDQIRLAALAKKLADSGATVIVSNAYHEEIFKLYPKFEIKEVARKTTLASSSNFRGSTTEAIIYRRQER
jgi:DNA adenine methylase